MLIAMVQDLYGQSINVAISQGNETVNVKVVKDSAHLVT